MSISVWQDDTSPGDVVTTDVIIVGAGISGASIAWWLKDAGLDVVVLDKGEVCAGATGKNAGFITCGSVEHFNRQMERLGVDDALALWRMSQDNIDLIEELLVGDGLDCDFARRGTYSLAGTEQELGELRETCDTLHGLGMNVDWIEREDVLRDLGAEHFTGGVLYQDDGEVHPVKLTRGMLARSGARVFPHHEVRDIASTGDTVTIKTQRATFEGTLCILATNGYSHTVHPWFREKIYPTRGQIIVTEPVAPFLPAPCYANFVLDYFRQLPDGRVLIGGFRQLEKEREIGTADEPSPVIHAALEDFLHKHFPRLRGVKIDYHWAGIMGFSVDGLPMIGALPGSPNIYFLGGYTAHGIGWGFKAGQLLSRLILDGEPPPIISARRFH
jgi:gamma-glutamylputrescine oxidase